MLWVVFTRGVGMHKCIKWKALIYISIGCVSILASFCVWTISLKCKDAVNRGSTIQSLQVRRNSSSLSAVRTIEPSRPDAYLSTDPSIRTTCHPVRTLDRPASSVRTKCLFRSDPILYREVSVPACIRPDVSAACPDASQYSISFWFPSKFQEREDQSTVRTMWYPVQTHVSVRQESQFKYDHPDVWQLWSGRACIKEGNCRFDFNRPDDCHHGPDACITDMEIACWRIVFRTPIPHGPDVREPYKEITCSGRATVRTMSLNKKDFSAGISENLFSQLSVRTAHVHRPDGA
jgi:hypothetical protein